MGESEGALNLELFTSSSAASSLPHGEMERGSLNYSPAAPSRPIPPINPITLIIPIFKSFSL